jgi:hypothetical protein
MSVKAVLLPINKYVLYPYWVPTQEQPEVHEKLLLFFPLHAKWVAGTLKQVGLRYPEAPKNTYIGWMVTSEYVIEVDSETHTYPVGTVLTRVGKISWFPVDVFEWPEDLKVDWNYTSTDHPTEQISVE